MKFTYFMPTKLFFGSGSVKKLAKEPLPGKKALIVISSGNSMRRLGYLDQVVELLAKNGAESAVFDKILPNPTDAHVMEGAAMAKKEGCDFVVGLGGGSSIDSAKCIAVMATNPGDFWDYVHGGSGKGQAVPNTPLPVVAITTTAGTGTEADPWAVTTKVETGEKIGFGYAGTFPVFSIIDPDLMQSVPSRLAAMQGFDALFHSLEGYIATIANPISDLFALKAIAEIFAYLPRVVNNPEDKEAWAHVALANTLAGIVESASSCTSEHAIEHALSGFHPELPHGAGLIAVSLAYFDFFADKVPDRVADLAKAAGVANPSGPKDFVKALEALQKACKVDDIKLSDYGVENDPAKYAKHAQYIMPGLFSLDRYTLSVEETAEIIRKSYR